MKALLFLSLLMPAFSHAGGAVGNGGDVVFCSQSSANSFSGYYALDYIIDKINEMEFSNDFEDIVKNLNSPDANFERIIQAVKEYPSLAQDLKEFRQQIYSNQYLKRYVWKKAPYGVVEINDEQLRAQIPPNCLDSSHHAIQAVIRVQKPWTMQWLGEDGKKHWLQSTWGADFTYSNEILNQMTSLQLSFLYFHEWLRNLTDDPEVVRDLNALFHSKGWENGGADSKIQILLKFKLFNKVPAFLFSKKYPEY